MTTMIEARPVPRVETHARRRIWNVVKLQFTNRWNMLALPWIVLGAIFLLDLAIWIIVNSSSGQDASAQGSEYGAGATYYIFFYMIVVAVQAINLTFPFALGYSVTRRDYYLGTSLAFLIQSALFTIGFVLLSYIEQWTGGWWWHIHLFHIAYFGNGPLWERLFTIFVLFLFCFFIGTIFATMYVRWKLNGALALGIAVAILLVGAIAIISFSHSWMSVLHWFADTGTTGILAWSLVPTAIAAVCGYFVLRRATPRS